MARPFSSCASLEAHAEESEARAGRRFAERESSETATPISRDAAQAAGTAVHRLLETLALAGDPGEELARRTGELDALPPDAAARARELCERFSSNGMLERLAGLAEHVVARELAVLVPPAESTEDAPVGFVSGAIDLLYRDPGTGELVVADYKTDQVESEAEIAERAEHYRAQGAVYVDAVQRALGLAYTPRFELWFLHAGVVVAG
jgi:ATP-dependent exoDNAse (exonuclease V) beta subunit